MKLGNKGTRIRNSLFIQCFICQKLFPETFPLFPLPFRGIFTLSPTAHGGADRGPNLLVADRDRLRGARHGPRLHGSRLAMRGVRPPALDRLDRRGTMPWSDRLKRKD